jgi:hypothetical protein
MRCLLKPCRRKRERERERGRRRIAKYPQNGEEHLGKQSTRLHILLQKLFVPTHFVFWSCNSVCVCLCVCLCLCVCVCLCIREWERERVWVSECVCVFSIFPLKRALSVEESFLRTAKFGKVNGKKYFFFSPNRWTNIAKYSKFLFSTIFSSCKWYFYVIVILHSRILYCSSDSRYVYVVFVFKHLDQWRSELKINFAQSFSSNISLTSLFCLFCLLRFRRISFLFNWFVPFYLRKTPNLQPPLIFHLMIVNLSCLSIPLNGKTKSLCLLACSGSL